MKETFTNPEKFAQALAAVEIKEKTKPQSASPRKGEPVQAAHLRELLSYIDPDMPRDQWVKIIAAIRNTPLIGDDDESQRRAIAHEWSEGRLWKHDY